MYTYICFLLILATARVGSHKESRLTTFMHLIFKILTRLFFCYHVKDLTRKDALLSLSLGREYGLFPFLHFDGHSPSCYSILNAPLNGIRNFLYAYLSMLRTQWNIVATKQNRKPRCELTCQEAPFYIAGAAFTIC